MSHRSDKSGTKNKIDPATGKAFTSWRGKPYGTTRRKKKAAK